MWKPLPSRRVLETLKGSLKGKTQRGQYLLAAGLVRYKWYQSQTPGDVPTRRVSLEGGLTRCGVPARMLGPEGGGGFLEDDYVIVDFQHRRFLDK